MTNQDRLLSDEEIYAKIMKITDFGVIKKMLDVLDGTTSFDSATPLGYD